MALYKINVFIIIIITYPHLWNLSVFLDFFIVLRYGPFTRSIRLMSSVRPLRRWKEATVKLESCESAAMQIFQLHPPFSTPLSAEVTSRHCDADERN